MDLRTEFFSPAKRLMFAIKSVETLSSNQGFKKCIMIFKVLPQYSTDNILGPFEQGSLGGQFIERAS